MLNCQAEYPLKTNIEKLNNSIAQIIDFILKIRKQKV